MLILNIEILMEEEKEIERETRMTTSKSSEAQNF